MQLSIDRIAAALGEQLPFSVHGTGESVLPVDFGLRLEDNVAVEGVAKNIGEGYFDLSGSIIATFAGSCDRCTGEAETMVMIPFAERYLRRNGAPMDHIDEETEIYFFSENTIDLTAMVRDNLALNAPLKLLCREDCAGLCPICGVDRNQQPCSCVGEASVDEEEGSYKPNPFAVLSQWMSDDEEV